MKLNPDCVRDILLEIEATTDLSHYQKFSPGSITEERFSKYSEDELFYHMKQCELSGFLNGVSWDMSGGCSILYLSPRGHQFLENIREDNNWNKTKKIAKNVGSSSLNVLTDIASKVVASLITAQLGQ